MHKDNKHILIHYRKLIHFSKLRILIHKSKWPPAAVHNSQGAISLCRITPRALEPCARHQLKNATACSLINTEQCYCSLTFLQPTDLLFNQCFALLPSWRNVLWVLLRTLSTVSIQTSSKWPNSNCDSDHLCLTVMCTIIHPLVLFQIFPIMQNPYFPTDPVCEQACHVGSVRGL